MTVLQKVSNTASFFFDDYGFKVNRILTLTKGVKGNTDIGNSLNFNGPNVLPKYTIVQS
jgi:hypothetical protein